MKQSKGIGHKDDLGKLGKDRVSGFTGIITAKCLNLLSDDQYSLESAADPTTKRGSVEWFSCNRVDIISPGIHDEKAVGKVIGFQVLNEGK